MYRASFKFVPEFGQEAAVREAVEERGRAFHASGIRASVWQEVAGKDRQAVYSAIPLVDKLADLSAIRAGENAKPNDVMRGKLKGELRDASTTIYEVLFQALPPATPEPGFFINVVTRTPLPGKANELRKQSIERGQALEKQRGYVSVRVETAGPDASNCEIIHFHSTLDSLEERRAAGTDAGRQQV